jgi:hypothetical protein
MGFQASSFVSKPGLGGVTSTRGDEETMRTEGSDKTVEETTQVLESLLKAFYKMYQDGGCRVTEDGILVSDFIMETGMSFVASPPPTDYLELIIKAGWIEFGRRPWRTKRRLQSPEVTGKVDLHDCIKRTLPGTQEVERLQQPAYRRHFKEACGFVIENAAKGATDAAIRRLLHQ